MIPKRQSNGGIAMRAVFYVPFALIVGGITLGAVRPTQDKLPTHTVVASEMCAALSHDPYHTKVIASPGCYKLTEPWDYIGAADTSAITITADNVTLDLNGYYISGSPSKLLRNHVTGIAADGRKNIRIANGTINQFFSGIILSDVADGRSGRNPNSAGITIESMTLTDIDFKAIEIAAAGYLIRNNRLSNIGQPLSMPGVRVFGINAAGGYGSIESNTIRNLLGDHLTAETVGISIDNAGEHVKILDNTITNDSPPPTNKAESDSMAIWIGGALDESVRPTIVTIAGNTMRGSCYGILASSTIKLTYRNNSVVLPTNSPNCKRTQGWLFGDPTNATDGGGNTEARDGPQ
jgi:hypothetical protein